MAFYIGRAIRETGQAIDRLGQNVSGNIKYREQLNRHQKLLPLNRTGKKPKLGENVFVAENATLVGDVSIGSSSSVWYGTTLRADINSIKVGNNSVISENCTIHVNSPESMVGKQSPTLLGDNVFIQESCTLHGCTVQDGAFVRTGSVILDDAVIGKGSIIEPGSLVPSGKVIPDNQVWAGIPARFVRDVSESERNEIQQKLQSEINLAQKYNEAYEYIRNSDAKETESWPEFWDSSAVSPKPF